MKLSKAQQTVIDQAKTKIDYARAHSFEEWHIKVTRNTIEETKDRHRNRPDEFERHIKWYANRYEEEKNGLVLTHCNSKTLYKLQQFGFIEIVEDSKGQSYGIDTIKLLNY